MNRGTLPAATTAQDHVATRKSHESPFVNRGPMSGRFAGRRSSGEQPNGRDVGSVSRISVSERRGCQNRAESSRVVEPVGVETRSYDLVVSRALSNIPGRVGRIVEDQHC
jgi:hypothetical protein